MSLRYGYRFIMYRTILKMWEQLGGLGTTWGNLSLGMSKNLMKKGDLYVCESPGKSLKIGTTLRKSKGEGYWVDFRYEKLSSFCFCCGVIGHAEKFCPLLYEDEGQAITRPFGPWLKASGKKVKSNMGNK
ncbi:unnamed protein product [Cuscuta epithymum]|uniref:Zinc knuckle CX2CX4HX4C domain-containing protein n=1 Tax=Cuscuta epithymum TaxID=186058 RepID=A0AAV0EN82_9ASTE|nr:unnamed protein product [Cuscuta epithymum]